MKSKTFKLLRNIFMGVGIVGGFIVWKFVPAVITNTSMYHVGNGKYGSKIGMLILLLFPLFSLCFRPEIPEFHGDDEELMARETEISRQKAYSSGMVLALVMSALVIVLMVLGITKS